MAVITKVCIPRASVKTDAMNHTHTPENDEAVDDVNKTEKPRRELERRRVKITFAASGPS